MQRLDVAAHDDQRDPDGDQQPRDHDEGKRQLQAAESAEQGSSLVDHDHAQRLRCERGVHEEIPAGTGIAAVLDLQLAQLLDDGSQVGIPACPDGLAARIGDRNHRFAGQRNGLFVEDRRIDRADRDVITRRVEEQDLHDRCGAAARPDLHHGFARVEVVGLHPVQKQARNDDGPCALDVAHFDR